MENKKPIEPTLYQEDLMLVVINDGTQIGINTIERTENGMYRAEMYKDGLPKEEIVVGYNIFDIESTFADNNDMHTTPEYETLNKTIDVIMDYWELDDYEYPETLEPASLFQIVDDMIKTNNEYAYCIMMEDEDHE